jgi:hypothetical protein
VLVGPEHVFALLDDDPDWIVASRLTITTEVDGTVRSERKTDQVAEASLQLDDGDRRASVTITFTQEPVAEDAPPCTQTVARNVVGFRRYTIGNCLDLSYRPRRIIVACGDGNYQLLRIRWRDWNARIAKGTGQAWINDCNPYCAAGRFHGYRVRLRASRVRRCRASQEHVGEYQYTRLRVTYLQRPSRRFFPHFSAESLDETHNVTCFGD